MYRQFFDQHQGVSILALELMLSRCEIDKDFETSLNLLKDVENFSSKSLASCLRSLDSNQYRDNSKITRSKLQDLLNVAKMDLNDNRFTQTDEVCSAFMTILHNSKRYSVVADLFYAKQDDGVAKDVVYWREIIGTTFQSLAALNKEDAIFHIIEVSERSE